MTVDVIIPTYKPNANFIKLIEMLEKQTVAIRRIIIINTEEQYFANLMYGNNLELKYNNVEVHHISHTEFDHGKTRRDAVEYSQADIFICMTQDAMPKDELLVEKLIGPIVDDVAVSSYARQIAYPGADAVEAVTRRYNYPPKSRLKTREDLEKLGIKTYFCSNVCAAYDRKTYDKLGGFPETAIFNEDMIYAGKVINAGYSIFYEAEASVYHSHNYTPWQQFRRNFDNGVSQADNMDLFANVPSEGEGKRMIKYTIRYLFKRKKLISIIKLIVQSVYKYIGFKCGRNYKKFSRSKILKWTLSPAYWNKKWLKSATAMIDPYSGYGIGEDERK